MIQRKKADMTAKSLIVLVLSVLVIWIAFKLFIWITGLYDTSMESYAMLAEKINDAPKNPVGRPESMAFTMTSGRSIVGFSKGKKSVEVDYYSEGGVIVHRPAGLCQDVNKACICLCGETEDKSNNIYCNRPHCRQLDDADIAKTISGKDFGIGVRIRQDPLNYQMINGFILTNSNIKSLPHSGSSQLGANVIRGNNDPDGNPVVYVCFHSSCTDAVARIIKDGTSTALQSAGTPTNQPPVITAPQATTPGIS